VEIAARRQARLLEEGHELVAGGARVGRGLEDDELALLEHPGKRGPGRNQRLQVGLPVAREGRRDGDDDRVDLGQVRVAGRGVQALPGRDQRLVRHVLDMRAPGGQRLDYARIGVHPDHVMSGLAERHSERQPDVAETHDPDLHRR
jgi:hypothetical protein